MALKPRPLITCSMTRVPHLLQVFLFDQLNLQLFRTCWKYLWLSRSNLNRLAQNRELNGNLGPFGDNSRGQPPSLSRGRIWRSVSGLRVTARPEQPFPERDVKTEWRKRNKSTFKNLTWKNQLIFSFSRNRQLYDKLLMINIIVRKISNIQSFILHGCFLRDVEMFMFRYYLIDGIFISGKLCRCWMCSLEFLDLEAWGKRLLQLLCLLLVFDDQFVQESGATHLELVVVGILLDLDTFGVLPSGFQEEVLKFKWTTLKLWIDKWQHEATRYAWEKKHQKNTLT